MKPLCVCGHSEGRHAHEIALAGDALARACTAEGCPCCNFVQAEETRTGSSSFEPFADLAADGIGGMLGVRGKV